jgi:DNA primase
MIKPSSIQEVKNRINIVEVVGEFLKLDRNHKAKCPFHNEKSSSFSVNAKKEIYKCFGCGEGGTAITFLMKHEKMEYLQAIQWLADRYSVTLEFEEETEHQKKIREEQKDLKKEMLSVTKYAFETFHTSLINAKRSSDEWKYIFSRGFNEQTAIEWGFGYSPNEWKFLTTDLINKNLYQPSVECGLIVTKDGNSYDFYKNRITIPIRDHLSGDIIGFGGRHLPKENEAITPAKYFNPKESLIYKKSITWFGLFEALTAKAFTKKNGVEPPAYIVEGYFDVIAMHEAGISNTVAGCGTSITLDQIKVLKKHTNHFVILTDGDDAGIKAAARLINMCLVENVRLEIVQLPKDEDPHSYITSFSINQQELQTGAYAD